jgi:hypothetical protein
MSYKSPRAKASAAFHAKQRKARDATREMKQLYEARSFREALDKEFGPGFSRRFPQVVKLYMQRTVRRKREKACVAIVRRVLFPPKVMADKIRGEK